MNFSFNFSSYRVQLLMPAIIAALVLIQTGDAPRAASSAAAGEDQGTEEIVLLSKDELFDVVGPIALYPDELVAIVLPGSTYPLEIVQAARYLAKYEKNKDLKPSEKWDSSVLGLLNYPEVINLMNDDLDWTWKLGEAVINQQDDVIEAIQAFRRKAKEAGNLNSDKEVVIVEEKEIIEIRSTSTEVIYVPTYNPSTVIVYSAQPYVYVYSPPYPYYHQPAAAFWTGLFVGAAIRYGVGWRGRGDRHVSVNVSGGNRVNWSRGGGKGRRPGGARPGGRHPGAAGGGRRPGAAGGGRSPGAASGGRNPGAKSGGRSPGATSGGRSPGAASGGRSPSSKGGSFGGYKQGKQSAGNSRRGQQSRSSHSTTRRSSGSRGAGRSGGRGGGGRRR